MLNNQHTIESVIRRIKYAIVKKMATNLKYSLKDIFNQYKNLKFDSFSTSRNREVRLAVDEFMEVTDRGGEVTLEVAKSWFKNINDPTDKITMTLKKKHAEFGSNVYRTHVNSEDAEAGKSDTIRLLLLGVPATRQHLMRKCLNDMAVKDCLYANRTWEGEQGEIEFIKSFILHFVTRNYGKILNNIYKENGVEPEDRNKEDVPLDDDFSFASSKEYSPIHDTIKTSKQIGTLRRKLARQRKENDVWRKLGINTQRGTQDYIAQYTEAYLTSEVSLSQLLVSDNETNQYAGKLMLKHEGKAFVYGPEEKANKEAD